MKLAQDCADSAEDSEFQETGISFTTDVDPSGLEIVDPIERHRFAIETPASVTPTYAATATFPRPVDAARSIRTESLRFDSIHVISVLDAGGHQVTESNQFTEASFDDGEYVLEIMGPMKVYVQVAEAFTIETSASETRIRFEEPAKITVGARSRHKHPAGTITTPAEPEAMMAAVSALGSGLKTTTPERAYPTLRGHPPLVELGETLDIPEGLEAPESGVTIEVPPDFGSIFTVASLAYYTGATLEPAESPRLVTDTGFEYSLDGPTGFEDAVARTLRQLLFLDCVVRTEGYYQIPLAERDAVESAVDFDFASVYDAPLAGRIETYLEVPFETIEDEIPEWKLSAHVMPQPDSIEYLPFIVNELGIVRTQTDPERTEAVDQVSALDSFTRNDFFRSASSDTAPTPDTFVTPESSEGLSQTWVGDGAPAGASKACIEGYHNRLSRTPSEDDITIGVVTNDDAMDDESTDVRDVYGSRENLPFQVIVQDDLTVGELEIVLQSDLDFFHYIGHVDEDGFQCVDGKLDVRDLDSVSVDSFLLNACRSYDQGKALVERGAVGGVVTLREVVNSGAVQIGQTMARLLNKGFPLQGALELAKDETVVGQQYIVIGDGQLAIAQTPSNVPNYCTVSQSGDMFHVLYNTYPTTEAGMGSVVKPLAKADEPYYLNSGTVTTYSMRKEELSEFFSLENIPIKDENRLLWSEDITVEDL